MITALYTVTCLFYWIITGEHLLSKHLQGPDGLVILFAIILEVAIEFLVFSGIHELIQVKRRSQDD